MHEISIPPFGPVADDHLYRGRHVSHDPAGRRYARQRTATGRLTMVRSLGVNLRSTTPVG